MGGFGLDSFASGQAVVNNVINIRVPKGRGIY
jgi:hypothetical protein